MEFISTDMFLEIYVTTDYKLMYIFTRFEQIYISVGKQYRFDIFTNDARIGKSDCNVCVVNDLPTCTTYYI